MLTMTLDRAMMTANPVKRSSHFQPRLPGFRFFRGERMPCPFERVRIAIDNVLVLAPCHPTEHVRLGDDITLIERVCPKPPRRDDNVVPLPDLQCMIQTFNYQLLPTDGIVSRACSNSFSALSLVLNRHGRRLYSTSSGWPMTVCSFTY